MLVEDNPKYRAVIQLALEDESDIDLTCKFGTAEMALRSLNDPSKRQEPDLVLLDLSLPGMSGLDALPFFQQELPNAKILILTQSDAEADVPQAISRGASGYLMKSAALNEITDGIRNTFDGGASLDPCIAKFILHTLQQHLPKGEIDTWLTARELEVLTLLGDGLLKKQIAEQLQISYTTVDYHVRNIYEKLEVQNAPAAVRKAGALGLFPPLGSK